MTWKNGSLFLLISLLLPIPPAWSVISDDGLQEGHLSVNLIWDEEAPSGFTIELCDKKMSGLEDLRKHLDELGKDWMDTEVLIKPGKKIQYTQVVKVVDECIKAGFTHIVFGVMPSRLDEHKAYNLLFQALPLEENKNRDFKELLRKTVAQLKNRLDSLGMKEAEVRITDKRKILVHLPPVPGGMAGERIPNLLQAPGELEFLISADDEILEEKREELIRYLQTLEAEKGGWDFLTDLSGLTFSATHGERMATYRWVPYSSCYFKDEPPVNPLQPKKSFKDLGLDIDREPGAIHKYFELVKRYDDARWRFTTDDLESATSSADYMRNPAVGFTFKPSRKKDFRDFTRNHINQKMAIILEGRIQCNPVINSEIPGAGIISGPYPDGFSEDEQKVLVATLRSGRLMMALKTLSIEVRDE